MGLFSKAQIAKINEIANKTIEPAKTSKSAVSKSVATDVAKMSETVIQYFQDSKAILIDSVGMFHEYVSQLLAAGIAGIDTETTGLDRINDTIVGVSLYYPGGLECYIPIAHKIPLFDEPYKHQLTYSDVRSELSRIENSNTKLIFANADFDLAMIYKDIKVDLVDNCFYDVIIAWRCLKENEPHNGLKELYSKYVLKGKGDPKKFSDFFTPALFPYCKPEVAKLYAANDAKITYELYLWQLPYSDKKNIKCQKNHLEAVADLLWNVELPLIKVCHMMHRCGAYVDKNVCRNLQERYHNAYDAELNKLADMIQTIIDDTVYSDASNRPFRSGKDFNPKSPPHVEHLLYSMLKIPEGKSKGKSKGKSRGTGKEILNEINLPVTNQILKVRSLSVLINTFVDKLPKSTTSDSRIHAQFKQLGADCITGDSIIPTSDGYHMIRDMCNIPDDIPDGQLYPVDNVSVVNKYQQIETASDCVRYRDVETIKITTELGLTIEGTPNHPIMVSKYNSDDKSNYLMYYYKGEYPRLNKLWEDRRFKRLDEISIGDLVEIPCNYQVHGEYQPTNLVLSPVKRSKFKDVTIPDIFTEDFAEFLGMYHADGHSALRDGTYTITLSNDDPDVYGRFESLSKSLFNVPISQYTKQRDMNEVDSYINCMQLKNLDNILCHGARNKTIPKAIWISPANVINSYIRGMTLDSTVYADEKGRINLELSVMQDDDARFIQQVLLSQGIYCHMSRNDKSVDNQSFRLCFNADNYIRFRDSIGFIESRKIKDTKPCFNHQYHHRRVGNSFYVKVKQIEHSHNDVYDFKVPESHSFISNGMISHNTGRMSSAEPRPMFVSWARKIKLTQGRVAA